MKRDTIIRIDQIKKRLTAFMVAVVFVFGTAILPADIYGAETTDSNTPAVGADAAATAAGEAAAEGNTAEESSTGATKADEQVAIAEDTGTEAEAAENATAEAAEEAAADKAVVEELTDAVAADLEAIDESEYDGFIYKLADDTTTKEIKEMEDAIDELGEDQEVSEVVKQELYAADSIETIAEVAEPDTIEYIEPNFTVQALGTNDVYYEDYGWYLDMINAPYVWNKGMTGKGITVAVLDSGVDQDHEDLCDVSYTTAKYNALNDTTDVTDDYGHGTKVTGVIAASYNNGKGLTGVMPGATILPVKVLNSTGGGSVIGIIAGIEFAINQKANVINMSFGGTFDGTVSMALEAECQKAADAGIILVAAAGNNGSTTAYYPAAYSTVVSVASVGSEKRHSSFSTHNKYVAVSAPGEYICMPSIDEYMDCYGNPVYYTADGNDAAASSGTSFSTPQVSAMAAMVKALDPSINYTGFMDVIKKTSTDLGPIEGFDHYFGYGLMDLSKAYRYVAGDIFMYSASLSTTSYVYNNTVRTPAVTLKNGTKTLARSKYTVSYPSGRKAVGTYKVTVTNKGKFTGSKTLTFKIMPPLVRALKSPVRYNKKLKVRWYAMTSSQKTKYKGGITGYQVRVSKNSGFTNAKYVKVTGATKTYAVVKNLKRKTTYYIQYRSYKTVGSTTYYSKWSSKKKTKTK